MRGTTIHVDGQRIDVSDRQWELLQHATPDQTVFANMKTLVALEKHGFVTALGYQARDRAYGRFTDKVARLRAAEHTR